MNNCIHIHIHDEGFECGSRSQKRTLDVLSPARETVDSKNGGTVLYYGVHVSKAFEALEASERVVGDTLVQFYPSKASPFVAVNNRLNPILAWKGWDSNITESVL